VSVASHVNLPLISFREISFRECMEERDSRMAYSGWSRRYDRESGLAHLIALRDLDPVYSTICRSWAKGDRLCGQRHLVPRPVVIRAQVRSAELTVSSRPSKCRAHGIEIVSRGLRRRA